MTDFGEQMLPAMNTIRGDLRDTVIGAIAQMDVPWKDLPEDERFQLANMIDAHAQNLVNRMAVLIATAGAPAVLVNLEYLTVGAEARGVISVPKDAAAPLLPHTGQIIALVPVGANRFMGEAKRAAPVVEQSEPRISAADIVKTADEPTITIVAAAPQPNTGPKEGDTRYGKGTGKPTEVFHGGAWTRLRKDRVLGTGTQTPQTPQPNINGSTQPKARAGSPFAR